MRAENDNRTAFAAGRLVLLALVLAVGGCSTSSLNPFSSPKSTDAAAAPGAEGTADIGDDDLECPTVIIRNGASTLTVANKSTGNADPAALDLRYQGSIVRTARECQVRAGTMTIKVGIDGGTVARARARQSGKLA